MGLFNSENKFGLLTKFVHWSLFVLIVFMYSLIYYYWTFDDSDNSRFEWLMLHKSLGPIVFTLAVVFFLLHFVGKRPSYPDAMPKAHKKAAHIGHMMLYLVLFAMPISGFLMSQLGGYPIKFFNLFTYPQLFEVNKSLGGIFHEIHEYTSYLMIALVSGHIMAALYHHFILKTNVLKRMTRG